MVRGKIKGKEKRNDGDRNKEIIFNTKTEGMNEKREVKCERT